MSEIETLRSEIATLRDRLEQQDHEIKALKNYTYHTKTINTMLEFVRARKVTNIDEMISEGNFVLRGGNRTKLYDAMRSLDEYRVIAGKNRHIPAILAYDDGTSDIRLIILRMYQRMQVGQQFSKPALLQIAKNHGDDIDTLQNAVNAMFTDQHLKYLMRGRLKFSKVGQLFKKTS